MTEPTVVLGVVVALLSALINTAIEYSSQWRRFWGFLLTIVILLAMVAGGAIMGIVIREAFEAIP